MGASGVGALAERSCTLATRKSVLGLGRVIRDHAACSALA